MLYRDAQKLASDDYNLDLVQVNQDEVSVYKIMDHGKWKYNQRKNKKKSHVQHTKEMNFKVRIDEHDLGIKVNQIKNFLSKGSEVKISVTMKGREKSHPEIARDKLRAILSELENLGQFTQPKSTLSSVTIVVHPLRNTHGNQTSSGNDSPVRKRSPKSQRENAESR